MSTSDAFGALLHSDDEQARREAARMMGRARSERKAAAARENAKKTPFDEAHRAKLREAQRARREREREAKVAAGLLQEETQEKRRPGRPRTRPEVEPNAPQRPVGRPKKETTAALLLLEETS